jgi:hypothetical protein
MNYERIVVLFIVLVIAYSILAPIFQPYLLWISLVFGILLIVFICCILMFPRFRQGVFSALKSIFTKLLSWLRTEREKQSLTSTKPQRTPIPEEIKKQVFSRAGGRCQIPGCKELESPVIHHIDQDRTNHRFDNLILLCSNHHTTADHRGFRKEQLHLWKEHKNLSQNY